MPAGVDRHRKQEFLSAADFKDAFGMDKEAFEGMPKWKQNTAKKKLKIF